jgi:hypothetical protein
MVALRNWNKIFVLFRTRIMLSIVSLKFLKIIGQFAVFTAGIAAAKETSCDHFDKNK